jgi:hypothetical protein
MSKGQDRSFEACWIVANFEHPNVEVGRYQHRPHCLPALSAHEYDSIWVIVDRFTKSAHLIPVHTYHKMGKYVELYIECILFLHGVPNTIISNPWA